MSSLTVNVQHLDKGPLHLKAELSPEELELESMDELIRFNRSVTCRLEVQKIDQGVLAQGSVFVQVECDCARCLRRFCADISLPQWVAHLALTGDESVPVVNDCVDLTPYLREDILLALPQHPLCSRDCQGLLRDYRRGETPQPGGEAGEDRSSPWGDLDKLDL